MRTIRRFTAPLVFLALALLPNVVTARVTRDATESWYGDIRKPDWNPPPWLFGPVWTVLYVMIAAAGAMLWRRRDERVASLGLTLWGVQMALNHAWSPLFFGWRRIGLAAFEVSALWTAIVALIVAARRVSRPAALLLLPYLGWVTFAAALNIRIWTLNRDGAPPEA